LVRQLRGSERWHYRFEALEDVWRYVDMCERVKTLRPLAGRPLGMLRELQEEAGELLSDLKIKCVIPADRIYGEINPAPVTILRHELMQAADRRSRA
jgi:hypothetical protein